jgi:cytochrome c
MKKTFILLAMATAIFSCGNNETKTADTGVAIPELRSPAPRTQPAKTAQSSTQDVSQNPDYKKGLALIGKNDCLACHKLLIELLGLPILRLLNVMPVSGVLKIRWPTR